MSTSRVGLREHLSHTIIFMVLMSMKLILIFILQIDATKCAEPSSLNYGSWPWPQTLEDKIINVKVPAGTQPGTILAVKGKGMPIHKTIGIRGNLYVKIHVLIPQLSTQDLKKIKDL